MGGKSLREGKIIHNASIGMLISMCGLVFTAVPNLYGYYAAARDDPDSATGTCTRPCDDVHQPGAA